MAATPDSAVTNGHGRASASSIVVAGDRTQSRRTARRHSRSVRILKVALPLTALGTIAIFAGALLKSADVSSGIPTLAMPQIVADNLKMQNPHYQGFNADGGRYWVRAKTAQQDLKTMSSIRLDGITGELIDVKKQKTNLVATRGLFDNKANILELYDSIKVTGDGGLDAVLTRATIKTKEGIITSDQPSTVKMGAGQITSNQLTIRQKTKEYTFLDTVRTHMTPKDHPPAATGQSAANQMPFGKPGEPVDIASNRLDIDDGKKTALFSGGVVATQAGASLKSPELTVIYEGAVTPQEQQQQQQATPQDSSGTKVKQIFARDSVVLEQTSGETATSRTAAFDSETNIAVLEGDVVLMQGADKKATGDRADYDQAAQTMVLTGPVVVTQGGNVLKGRRLVFHRVTDKLQLTAPGAGGAGRISAHFVKPASKVAPAQESTDQSSDGISFGPTFKTDPNAPYDVAADRLDVYDAAKTAVFTGNVVAEQGDMTIRSAELTAYYTGSAGLATAADAGKSGAAALTRIQARKKVTVLSKDGRTATGDWAEIDVKSNVATLGGAVVLTQGKNIVRGTKLLIDMNTGETTIKTEPVASNVGAAMVSSSESEDGQVITTDRPSAIFYPGQVLGSKKVKPALDAIDGWQARTKP
jgi:lipopolysaccharide transport protein LptA/LPS export ABC transporter protein LptC